MHFVTNIYPLVRNLKFLERNFLGHFTSLTILIHCIFWPISGLYIVTCLSQLPSEIVHRAPCRTKNYKYCIMLHPYPTLIIRIHYVDILNRQFIKNIENSYATIQLKKLLKKAWKNHDVNQKYELLKAALAEDTFMKGLTEKWRA